jgi:phosphoglycolate phosphatase
VKQPALIFDLDGTLVDSLPDLHAALLRMLGELGGAPLDLEQVRGMVGDGVKVLVARVLAATGFPEEALPGALARFMAIYESEPVARTRPYPGVAETLAELVGRGYRLGVCTNKPQRPTEAILAGLRLDRFFEAVIGGDRLPVRKPHPGHLLGVLDGLAAEPGAAVMIGDHANDIAVARNAGTAAILVRYGYGRDIPAGLSADQEIDRFPDLPEAVRRIEAGILRHPAGSRAKSAP